MTTEKWQKFSKEEQILNIAAELSRAKFWLEKKDREQTLGCLDRAFELIDLTIGLSRHQKYLREILRFREVLAQFYIDGNKSADEFAKTFKTLLMSNRFTSSVKI